MMAIRRLAAAARVGQRMPLQTPCYAASLFDARAFSTVQTAKEKRATATIAAYTRIANKMAAMPGRKREWSLDIVEAEIEDTVVYLQQRLGMTRLGAIRTVALHPMMIQYSSEVFDRKLAMLENMGVKGDMLTNAIRRCPNIVGISEEAVEKVIDWYLELGVDPKKIPYMFSVYPQAMSYSLENKQRKIDTLRDFGITDDDICRILHRFPQILTGNAEHFKVKVEFLKKHLGLTDEQVSKLLPTVPEVLLSRIDLVENKIKAIDTLFGPGTAIPMWLSRPRLIMYSLDTIGRSTRYLNEVVGYPIDEIATNITVVMRSVERVIRPRYEFLRHYGDTLTLVTRRWILIPDATFKEEHPEFDAFLKTEFKAKK